MEFLTFTFSFTLCCYLRLGCCSCNFSFTLSDTPLYLRNIVKLPIIDLQVYFKIGGLFKSVYLLVIIQRISEELNKLILQPLHTQCRMSLWSSYSGFILFSSPSITLISFSGFLQCLHSFTSTINSFYFQNPKFPLLHTLKIDLFSQVCCSPKALFMGFCVVLLIFALYTSLLVCNMILKYIRSFLKKAANNIISEIVFLYNQYYSPLSF